MHAIFNLREKSHVSNKIPLFIYLEDKLNKVNCHFNNYLWCSKVFVQKVKIALNIRFMNNKYISDLLRLYLYILIFDINRGV